MAEYARTMSLTAQIAGVDLQEGDRLLALNGAEIVGAATVADGSPVCYVSIAGSQSIPLSFVLERDGEIIAAANDVLTYKADAIVGSPAEPTVISFVQADRLPQDGWYSLQGVKLQGKPQQRGVYIHNGKKQVVK
jgi:hypothetical protein